MFPLHERTRRRFCLAGFVVFCVLPTAAVLGWGLMRHSSAAVEAEARRLSRLLGLSVTIEGICHLRPGEVLYEGLVVADPETAAPILRCRGLEVRRDWGGVVTVRAAQAEVAAERLDELGGLLRRALTGRAGPLPGELRVAAGEVALRGAAAAPTLRDVSGRLEAGEEAVQAELHFRIAGAEAGEPVRWSLVRNRQTAPPSLGFRLSTGDGALPAEVLALGIPPLAALGPASDFRGELWGTEAAQGWSGGARGRFSGLELDRLVTAHLPHQLDGAADLTVRRAVVEEGRLAEIEGTLAAGPGTVGLSLLSAAVLRLGLVPGEDPGIAGEAIPYERLAFDFYLDAQGLWLRGRCAEGSPVLLAARQGWLLAEPVRQPQPTAALVQALVPAAGTHVPATRQSDRLVRLLPWPAPETQPLSTAGAPPERR